MSTQLQAPETASQILQDHGERPLHPAERAHIWRHNALAGAELFYGSYRTHEFAPHFHTVPAIGVVDSGVMRSYCRHASHDVPAGTVILLNPGEVHAPGPASPQGWSFRVFFFDDARFSAVASEMSQHTYRFSQPFVQDPVLAQGLVRLHRSLEQTPDTLAADAMLLQVFERLAAHHVPLNTRWRDAHSTEINRAREYMDAFYFRDISLAELAAVAERSRYHLLRSFREAVGLTPHAYLIQVRIEAAKRLLSAGVRIAQVAADAGFADQSHLTRHFKRIMGVTPSRYALGRA